MRGAKLRRDSVSSREGGGGVSSNTPSPFMLQKQKQAPAVLASGLSVTSP